MKYRGKGTTTVRSRFARKLTTPNTDAVVSVTKIPPGCTLNWVDYNYLAIGRDSVDVKHATEVSLYAYLITDHNPHHGYGDNIAAYDSMWDDRVPKDKDPDTELEGEQETGGSADTGAIESGASDADAESDPGHSQLTAVLGLSGAPEQVFGRVQRLDVTNGLITESNKYKAIDKAKGRTRQRYHVPEDRYGYLLWAIGAPEFETADSFNDVMAANTYGNELWWQMLAYPELMAVYGMVDSGSGTNEIAGNFVRKNLEIAYIESDTYKDLDDGEGNLNELTCFMNTTANYSRPREKALHLTSRV